MAGGRSAMAERPQSGTGDCYGRPSERQFLFTQQRVFGAVKRLEKGRLVLSCAKLDRRIGSGQLGGVNDVYNWRVQEFLALKLGADRLTSPIGRELTYVEGNVAHTLLISDKLPHPTDPHAKLCDAVGILVLRIQMLDFDSSTRVVSINESVFDPKEVLIVPGLETLPSALGIEGSRTINIRNFWEFESSTAYFGSMLRSIHGVVGGAGSASNTIFVTPKWSQEAGLILETPKGLVLANNTNLLPLECAIRESATLVSSVIQVGPHPALEDEPAGYGGRDFGSGGRSGGMVPTEVHGGPNCMRGSHQT